jgi:arylsulfatase A-like enzyme
MNILYIMTDQQRFDDLGLYGLTQVQTPNLDALGSTGVRFDNAYSCCALCSPARASMLTGKYPHNHRMWNNNDMMQWACRDLPDEVELISKPLTEAGYQCGYIGKWHCGMDKLPAHYGFEGMNVPGYGVPYASPEYRDYAARLGLEKPEPLVEVKTLDPRVRGIAGIIEGDIRAEASYFLSDYSIAMMRRFEEESRRTGKPWFIFLSYWAPHFPYYVPRSYADRFHAKDMKLCENFHDDLEGKPPNHRRYRERYHRGLDHGEDTWRLIIARATAFMTYLDAQIGRVLDSLDELGISDRTAVLFGTDHGDMRGSHGKFVDKDSYMYEEIYHIPQIVRWPGVGEGGGVSRRFVLNMDLAPTALEVAGLPVPEDYDARSLAPLLRSEEDGWPDDVMCEYHGHRFLCSIRMIRWDHYKYVLNLGSFDELYDLKKDPHELHNRIDDPLMNEVAGEGRRRLMRRIEESKDDIRIAAFGAVGWDEAEIELPEKR